VLENQELQNVFDIFKYLFTVYFFQIENRRQIALACQAEIAGILQFLSNHSQKNSIHNNIHPPNQII